MPVVEERVFIQRPPGEVFDFIAEADNLPVWDVSVVKAEQVESAPAGPGTHTRGTSKVMGKQFDWITEVTAFEPPTRVVYTSVEGKLHFTVTSLLEPTAGGTNFTLRIDAETGLGGIFGRMADPFIAKAQARTVRANLETLAELLAEPATP